MKAAGHQPHGGTAAAISRPAASPSMAEVLWFTVSEQPRQSAVTSVGHHDLVGHDGQALDTPEGARATDFEVIDRLDADPRR